MKLLKKILCGILSATMLITSAAIPAMADEDIKVTLDGKALSFDVPPQIINDRTMVPLRAIFEALGASVDWNQETKTVTSTKGDTTIKLTIDSNTMYVNGNVVTLDTPACVVNDRTLVPVRAISEAYNTNVDWNGDTKTVTISSDSQTEPASQLQSIESSGYIGSQAFNRLKQHILNNGTYSSDNSYSYTEKLNDVSDICLTVNSNGKKIEIDLTTTGSNYTGKTTLTIDYTLFLGTLFRSPDAEYYMTGGFSTKDGTFQKFASNAPSSIEKELLATVNDTLGVFDNYLKLTFNGDVSLSDFNIAYIDSNGVSTKKTNTSSTKPSNSSNTNNNKSDKSSSYEKFKNELIAKGNYSDDTKLYALMADDGQNQFFFSYNIQDEEINILKEDIKNESAVLLTITENENPHVIYRRTFSNGSTEVFSGNYINSKLVQEVSSHSVMTTSSPLIISIALTLSELQLKKLGINITMADLGVSTD